MLAVRLLDSAEHHIALTKSEGADLLAVVVPQLLLINRQPGQSQHAGFFFQIDAVFSSFLGFCLRVQGVPR